MSNGRDLAIAIVVMVLQPNRGSDTAEDCVSYGKEVMRHK